ncbi:MAG TPA: HAD-IA family hydrolase [Steroidobacteraceae bacterium]|nr:HAD-IA family hydrolase [Steroidobacteraceae bacterium]
MHGSAHLPDWSAIDTVLLDMDGTLLDLGCDKRFWEEHLPRRLAESRGVDIDEARGLMSPVFESTAGTLDWYCVDHWSRALGVDIIALIRATRHEIDWLPEAREFLDRVRASGRRLALVTNAHPEILAIKDAHLGIRKRFDAVYSSHDFGEPKESAAFWPRLAEREPFDPARTLFADDNAAVLGAARGHGIRWLFAVRRPVRRAPARAANGFAGVESVLELAEGLAPAPEG